MPCHVCASSPHDRDTNNPPIILNQFFHQTRDAFPLDVQVILSISVDRELAFTRMIPTEKSHSFLSGHIVAGVTEQANLGAFIFPKLSIPTEKSHSFLSGHIVAGVTEQANLGAFIFPKLSFLPFFVTHGIDSSVNKQRMGGK